MYLIVDDDDIFRERLARGLQDRGYDVEQANSSSAAIELAGQQFFSRAIIDLRMPGENGLSLITELKKIVPQIDIVMLTGYGSISTAVEAMNLGCTNYLTKPMDIDSILKKFEAVQSCSKDKVIEPPTLKDVEWEHIQRVLRECSGNITKASKLLGIHRRSLQRKLNQL